MTALAVSALNEQQRELVKYVVVEGRPLRRRASWPAIIRNRSTGFCVCLLWLLRSRRRFNSTSYQSGRRWRIALRKLSFRTCP